MTQERTEETVERAHAAQADDAVARGPRRLVLLANDAMRARRRPATILALWAWQAGLALVLVWPATATVAAFYGKHPEGDAPLWREGGLALMSLGMRAMAAGPALTVHAGVVVLVTLALGVVPTAAAFTSLAFATPDIGPPSLRQVLGRAFATFRASVLVFLALTAVQILLVVVGATLAESVRDALYYRLGEARSEQVSWLVLLVALAGVAAVGVGQEVARAAVVRFRLGAGQAILLGVAALRRDPIRLPWSWGWRALASLVPVAFGALVAERLGGRGGGSLLALGAVHQVVALSRVGLRVSWLARAMRAADRPT